PDAVFSVVQRLAETQQAPLPVTQHTLWKRMHERGVLRRETAQQKNKVRRVIGGKTEYVIDIGAHYVSETGHSGHSGHLAPQHQQKQSVPGDLFPPWYAQNRAIGPAAKPFIALGAAPRPTPSATGSAGDDRFSPDAMTGFAHGIGQHNVPASPTNTMPMTGM